MASGYYPMTLLFAKFGFAERSYLLHSIDDNQVDRWFLILSLHTPLSCFKTLDDTINKTSVVF
jgi:hypothetical protein